jgi:hypothetical protein
LSKSPCISQNCGEGRFGFELPAIITSPNDEHRPALRRHHQQIYRRRHWCSSAAEEQAPIKVKGLRRAHPLLQGARASRPCGTATQIIREEQNGFKFVLDLQKHGKQEAILTLEAILARLRE